MNIKTIELNNFKKYTTAKFNFEPGFNLLYGQNEAGKSTLHQAIVAGLYGIGAAKDGLAAKSELTRIGSDLPPVVSLQILSKEQEYKITRNLQDAKVSLYELQNGEFVKTNEDSKKVAQKISQIIGLDGANLFNKTVAVKQLDTASIGDLEDLSKNIGDVVAGSGYATIDELEARLTNLRKKLKKERNEKPGELDLLEAKIQDYKNKLAQSASTKELQQTRTTESAKIAARLPRAEQELTEINALIAKWDKKKQILQSQKQVSEKLEILQSSQTNVNAIDEKVSAVHNALDGIPNLGFIKEHSDKLSSDQQPAAVASKNKVVFSVASAAAALLLLVLALFTSSLLYIPMLICVVLAVFFGVQTRRVESSTFGLTKEQYAQAKENLSKYQALEQELTSLLALKKTMEQGATEKQNQAKDFKAELSALQGLLLDYQDFNPDLQQVEKWSTQQRFLTQEIEQLKLAQSRLLGSQEGAVNQFDPWIIEKELSALQETYAQKHFIYQAAVEALNVLQETKQEFEFNYLPAFTELAQKYFQQITGSISRTINLKNWPSIQVTENGTNASHTTLSAGALDQLYFALRLAATDMLSKNTNLPLLLDDPFVTYDTNRLTAVIKMLGEVSKDRQTILFTHDKETNEIAKKTVANLNTLELAK